MTLAFQEGLIKDLSQNLSIAKTITVGIDDPDTGDGDNSGVIVDVVSPVWKAEVSSIDRTNSKVMVSLIATDKYLTGVENSTLTIDDITLTVDGDSNTNTIIKKELSTPTFSTNATTGMKEIKYTLTLSNWEEATKQTGKSFLEYSGNTKITIAAGTIRDDSNEYVKPSAIYDESGNNADGLHIGDFINYDAGTWTATEIGSIQTGLKTNLQTANGSATLPTNGFQFGGFAAGSSRNGNAVSNTGSTSTWDYIKDASTGSAITGWRVFDIDGDTVTLISAGNTEDYYQDNDGNSAYISEYILTGNINNSWSSSEAQKYQKRDWSIYVNKNQAVSAIPLTKERLDKWFTKYIKSDNTDTSDIDTFRKIYQQSYNKFQNVIDNYSLYWLAQPKDFVNSYTVNPDRFVGYGYLNGLGIRNLVTLKDDVLLNASKIGTKTLTGGNMNTYGGNQTYNYWSIAEDGAGISDGISNTSKKQTFDLGIIDVIKPEIEKKTTTANAVAQTATLAFNVTDKYLSTNTSITTSKIEVYVDGVVASDVTKTLTRVSENDISETVNGETKVVSQQFSLAISGFSPDAKQVKIKFTEGTLKDESGNTNKTTEIIVYNTLKIAEEEEIASSNR